MYNFSRFSQRREKIKSLQLEKYIQPGEKPFPTEKRGPCVQMHAAQAPLFFFFGNAACLMGVYTAKPMPFVILNIIIPVTLNCKQNRSSTYQSSKV